MEQSPDQFTVGIWWTFTKWIIYWRHFGLWGWYPYQGTPNGAGSLFTIFSSRFFLVPVSSQQRLIYGFQNIFTDLPCKHPVVVLKDVKYSEIKAILEYMYRGEVNVAQDQLAALLKVAEALKVKGLVEENRYVIIFKLLHWFWCWLVFRACKTEKEEPMPLDHSPSSLSNNSNSHINHNTVHSSSSGGSPPHSTNSMYKNPYSPYDRKGQDTNHKMNLPIWAVPGLPLPPHTAAVSFCWKLLNYVTGM